MPLDDRSEVITSTSEPAPVSVHGTITDQPHISTNTSNQSAASSKPASSQSENRSTTPMATNVSLPKAASSESPAAITSERTYPLVESAHLSASQSAAIIAEVSPSHTSSSHGQIPTVMHMPYTSSHLNVSMASNISGTVVTSPASFYPV